jgi:large subunit ribosomal protein L30
MAGRPLFSFVTTNYLCKRFNSNEGIKYHGFTYYPRFPGQQDPPYQPTKLLMVKRVKPVKGNPYWDKKLLRHFRLDGKVSISWC